MKLGFSVTNLLRHYSSLETIDIVARAGIDCIDFPFYEKIWPSLGLLWRKAPRLAGRRN